MYTLQESARGELSDATAAKSENTGTLLNACTDPFTNKARLEI